MSTVASLPPLAPSSASSSQNDEEESRCAIAILDLPVGSALMCDGQTIRLQRSDFVGIRGIPMHNSTKKQQQEEGNTSFHLVVARAAGCGSNEEQKHGNVAAVSIGFAVQTSQSSSSSNKNSLIWARRYDPRTEEVSSEPVDAVTHSNLQTSMASGQLEPQRIINYKDIVATEHQESEWTNLTQFISERLLQKRGIKNGSKIVPGSYREDDEDNHRMKVSNVTTTNKSTPSSSSVQDGSSVQYSPIPVIDKSKSARYSQHVGTKRFLAKLSPSDRTSLFVDVNPHNFVLQKLFQREYSGETGWEDILGDIQLSYILFLHLHCLSSLEHWYVF